MCMVFSDIMIYPNVLQISKTFHLILQNGLIAQILIHPTKFQDASPIGPSLITSDPPKHRNLRNSISEAFNPRQISILEPKIEKITHDLLEKVIQNKNMDLIQDLAYPLPVIIIAELLGIPNEDHHKFKRWADQIISLSINDKQKFSGRSIMKIIIN